MEKSDDNCLVSANKRGHEEAASPPGQKRSAMHSPLEGVATNLMSVFTPDQGIKQQFSIGTLQAMNGRNNVETTCKDGPSTVAGTIVSFHPSTTGVHGTEANFSG